VPALSKAVVTEFWELCNWAYEAWRTHRVLFDENPRTEELRKSSAGDALYRLSKITQEYVLHQIAKLHDPVGRSGQENLGIAYILNAGAWSAGTEAKLAVLTVELEELATKITAVRNKRLSHNDLTTILANTTLGELPKGLDLRYFEALQAFVNVVHVEVIGEARAFDDLVNNDAIALLHAIRVPT
jgi:AbiU2